MDKHRLLSVEKAVELLLSKTKTPTRHETVPLLDGLGRVIYNDFHASIDQPPFNRSPVDGYAVRHPDIREACGDTPVKLKVAQTVYAGDVPRETLLPGEAARVMTGTPIPTGATCVVRQEDTDGGENQVRIFTPLALHENFCFQGEDVSAGKLLIRSGERLDSAKLGVIAGQGKHSVKVHVRPSITVLSTGSELLTAGMPLEAGKIYDSNAYTLSARSRQIGAQVMPGSSLKDDPDTLTEAVEIALRDSDLVVTTGGVSVGARDYMPEVGIRLGAEMLFHGIAAKPGGPMLALKKGDKLILCLSGNPFAAYATFELLVVPVLRKLSGETIHLPERITGIMMESFNKPSHGRRFLRARIEGGNVFFPGEGHASGMLSSSMDCNCMIDIPSGTPCIRKGEAVEVVMFHAF